MTLAASPQLVSPLLFLKLWRGLDTAEREARTSNDARKVIFLRAVLVRRTIAETQTLDWENVRSTPTGSMTARAVLGAILQQQASYGRKGLVFFGLTRNTPMPFPRALWAKVAEKAGAPGLRITQFQVQATMRDRAALKTLDHVLREYVNRVGEIEFRPLRKLSW